MSDQHTGHVTIVVSRYNTTVTDRLLEGAEAAHAARQQTPGTPGGVVRVDAPGAFELPVLAMAAAKQPGCRGVLTLGCVIKGETRHDHFISQAVATAPSRSMRMTGSSGSVTPRPISPAAMPAPRAAA